jgi:hypothetical protein
VPCRKNHSYDRHNNRRHIEGFCSQANCRKPSHEIVGFHYNNVSIGDEGFRWKNTFNFTIGGQPINNWNFYEKITYNPVTRIFASTDAATDDSFPNAIHAHLAKIIDAIKNLNGPNCASVSIAAITIIVDTAPPQQAEALAQQPAAPNYHAYSKLMCNDNDEEVDIKPFIAINNSNNFPVSNTPDDLFEIAVPLQVDELPNIDASLECSIPNGLSYKCTEGKIISQLLDEGGGWLRNNIDVLLRLHQPDGELDYSRIKLIVLHIGTTMDPCAICTRCLTGFSRTVNYNLPNELPALHGINNAKFLIEVSSNGHYITTDKHQDNYALFGFGSCSHTECAGRDANETQISNIILAGYNKPMTADAAADLTLSIPTPNIVETNWGLSPHFPPYVIFGRMAPIGFRAVNAPRNSEFSELDVCGNSANPHCGHNGTVDHNRRDNLHIVN